MNLLGAERIVAVLALALVGCASIAGVDSAGDTTDDGADTDPGTATPASDATKQTGQTGGGPTSGGTTQTPTQPQTTPSTPTTPTTTNPPAAKKDLGGDCTKASDCKSNTCNSDGFCAKKPNESLLCVKAGTTVCVDDDMCCGNDYCTGKCQACRAAGESPDFIRGSTSCCSGVVKDGRCR